MADPDIGRIITSDACVAEGAAFLSKNFPKFSHAYAETGPLPLRLKPAGFAPLLNAIIGQQVSTASAAAIWARLETANFTHENAVRTATEDDLRACGLSRQKIRYAQALAEARIDYPALTSKPNTQVFKTLTAVSGIGQWTAEVYAMFSLGRADVFAHGDLALQEAAKVLFDLPMRPSEKQMRDIAASWSPWRAVAARQLWAYYRVIKNREGIR